MVRGKYLRYRVSTCTKYKNCMYQRTGAKVIKSHRDQRREEVGLGVGKSVPESYKEP